MSDVQIHPTAIVDPAAELGAGTIVGPYSVIAADVVLGPNCWLQHHVTLCGPMKGGEKNRFYAYCSIGQQTQDLKYRRALLRKSGRGRPWPKLLAPTSCYALRTDERRREKQILRLLLYRPANAGPKISSGAITEERQRSSLAQTAGSNIMLRSADR